MKHARADYNRIQDPSGIIPEDEPVFLLRSQDFVAPDIVELWADRAELAGAKADIVLAARQQAKKMRDWQIDLNRVKIPDL
jgi:hypothetical protein